MVFPPSDAPIRGLYSIPSRAPPPRLVGVAPRCWRWGNGDRHPKAVSTQGSWLPVVVLEFPDEQAANRFDRSLKSGSGRAFAIRQRWRRGRQGRILLLTRTRGMFFDFDHALVRGLCTDGKSPCRARARRRRRRRSTGLSGPWCACARFRRSGCGTDMAEAATGRRVRQPIE